MKFNLTRRQMLAGTGGLTGATLFAPSILRAQGYPTQVVTVAHGFGAGGNSDGLARVAAEGLTARLGQSFVVDPRPGAGGTTAADQVARANPDGNTLIMFTGAHAVAAALYKELPYDTLESFDYVSLIAGDTPFALATYMDHPANNIAEMLEYARNAPAPLTYATSGIGTTLHLAMELLAQRTGIQLQHIPYRQNSQSMVDLMAKRLDLIINGPASIFPQIQSGEIKPLGVTSKTRYADLPDVPAIAEVVPDYEVITWYGIAAPKGAPAEVITTLQAALAEVVKEPANIDRIRGLGSTAKSSTPQEFHDLVALDVAKWTEVVQKAGIEQN